MSAFLEDRLPVMVRMGASYGDDFDVRITETASGLEYRQLVHPYPRRRFVVRYTRETEALWDEIVSLYLRCYGRFAGFRVRALDDYSTNARTGAPTPADQVLALVEPGIYQLQVQYGGAAPMLDIGPPARTIFKPVPGSVLVSVQNPVTGSHTPPGISIDTATGRISFPANNQRAITGITQAAQAVITVGSNTYTAGNSVHISGVQGMTQINGRRATVVSRTASTITVDINTTGFSAYSSAGTVNTRPQSGETVRGGCEFDIPCRFVNDINVAHVARGVRETSDIELIELLNP